MTEAEAKTKWCPFARATSDNDAPQAAANRWPDNDTGSNPFGTDNTCIASACIAWRWIAFSKHNVQPFATRELAEAYIEEMKEYSPPELPRVGGYCGLAGKP